jgi:hypothetical protein
VRGDDKVCFMYDWIDLSLWIEQLSVFHVCWIETVDVVVKVQERMHFTLIDTFSFGMIQ